MHAKPALMPPALNADEVEHVYNNRCRDVVSARRDCWYFAGEARGGELCLREELLEKRCLAKAFCKREYKAFYVLRGGECQQWAERFVWGESEASDKVQTNKYKVDYCREVVMDLSRCLGQYRRLSPEFVAHRDDVE